MQAATAYVNLSALKSNLARIKQQVPSSKVAAIIKANAYGHGVVPVAVSLGDADAFGVARLEEAIELRTEGIEKPILLLEGFYAASDVKMLSEYDLQTAIHCEEQLLALEQACLTKPITVWLKIDTGMHRLGVRPEQVEHFIERLTACDNVQQPLCFISHFGCADELDNPITTQQIQVFKSLTDNLGPRSLAASSGILMWPDSHFDWIRPGIIMYGISPFSDSNAQQLGFQPVMTLTSHLIAVRDVKVGESVGYGATWTSKRDTKMGVIAMGYGDGYPRTAPNGTPVLVNGRRVELAGRVSMDMLTVDLGPDSQDEVGDEAIFWGENLPAEEVAQHIGTIAYELVTQLTGRVILKYTQE
ncbi:MULTISPECIES: alanine racemase [Vibrio]|uniref:Alanine racemase n=1 Tax=Vibrio algicola TaxID=2662262 RepID=A0A5Q0TFY2_9VIBR|nr:MULTISPECIES: alanine racemase [Vibrio]MBD1576316.1 alanine racemase [Vibrio sp. S11_S32]